MSAARHLWRRVLVRLRPADRRASSPADGDDALLALTDEFEAGDRNLRDLLARDGRDTEDVPGFDALADRQAELLALIVATPARGLAGQHVAPDLVPPELRKLVPLVGQAANLP